MNFGFIGKWLCTYAETCLSAFQDPLDPITALGGFSGNKYSEASAFIVTYPVNNAVDDVGNENGKALAWEKAFIQLAKDELLPMVLSRNLSLSFSAESSTEEELKRESTADVMTIIVSYLIMFLYISDIGRCTSNIFFLPLVQARSCLVCQEYCL